MLIIGIVALAFVAGVVGLAIYDEHVPLKAERDWYAFLRRR